MADSGSSFRSMAWSSVLLGLVLALAHVAWFSLNDDRLGEATADSAYVALTGLAVLGWLLVITCGALALATGRAPHPALAGSAAGAGAVAALLAVMLLALTSSGDHTEGAFDDVLLQAWPLLPLLLFAGDWVRRSRAGSTTRV